MRHFFLYILILGGACFSFLASSQTKKHFTFHSSLEHYNLLNKNYELFSGHAGRVGFGYGFFQEKWFSQINMDMLLGPYSKTPNKDHDVDYDGFGTTLSLGIAAPQYNLQNDKSGYGFLVEVRYTGLAGKEIGPSHQTKSQITTEKYSIEGFTNQATVVSFASGFFLYLNEEPFPKEKTSPLTQIKTHSLSFLMSFPLFSRYRTTYTNQHELEENKTLEEKRTVGKYTGYTLILSWMSVFS